MTRILKQYWAVLSLVVLAACSGGDSGSGAPAGPTQPSENPIVTGDMPRVRLETTVGDIVLELYPSRAPVTVENFLTYVDDGFYDGTLFHRVVPGFVIQGGGFSSGLVPRATRDPIINESNNGLHNLVGTIAMARTNELNSATSQFFINTNNNASLDFGQGLGGFAVFGKVVEGLNVVGIINQVQTGVIGPLSDVPLTEITILSASRESVAN